MITLVSFIVSLVTLVTGLFSPLHAFDARLNVIDRPYRFSIAGWEIGAWAREVRLLFLRQPAGSNDVTLVEEYFTVARQARSLDTQLATGAGNAATLKPQRDSLEKREWQLEPLAEKILEKQIRNTLAQLGIYNPLIPVSITFPPVNFQLAKPPDLLTISPRDRIEPLRQVLLVNSLTVRQMEAIEAGVDKLGVSSLVEGLGGFGGTYPSLVSNEESICATIETATEEWLHQYLTFKPLGFLYLLDLTGLRRDYNIATMDETLASTVSREIADLVSARYYADYSNGAPDQSPVQGGFDFNKTMHQIRLTTDDMLAKGQIERAEQYMEEQRLYLLSKGYYIRKLNQAYFAFHGTYADTPASVSPIGRDLETLRARFVSLADYVNTVGGMTSYSQLQRLLSTSQ